ncbi:m-phase inducer phosphatase [Coemansia nantahalensis]|uniref:M-phase inducer phosphatase n=1 Tax=Coemansia nantahalensis TaxID=2789366 RepID=A0ACC1K5N5_9FUNG|nr:m-phase inducer phosphatase [Coemansia nantahalensis]
MNAVASDRLPSRCLRGISSPNPFVATPSRPQGARAMANTAPPAAGRRSPVGGLASELDSSLHLDSDSGSPRLPPAPPPPPPPAFEPFGAGEGAGLVTPMLIRSRKRPMRDLGSPGLAAAAASNSPSAAFWARNRGRRMAAPTPLALATPSRPPPAVPATAAPVFGPHESLLSVDDDSSFDDDGSLTSLPRMRGSAIRTILEDRALDFTPLQSQASRIKRVRGQSTAIPSFAPLAEAAEEDAAALLPPPAAPAFSPGLSPCFSPSARSQPECHLLPCASAATDSIMRVDAETVSRLLAGGYDSLYDEKIVVDCRFPYEYEGGHIAGAVNAPTQEHLERLLLEQQSGLHAAGRRVVVVLHCEYSLQRAPSMACHLRRRDRERNMHRYPHLDYPEIYVLKGGYRGFFGAHKQLCEPQSYVEMNDSQHAADCRARMLQFNRTFKRTKSFGDNGLARSFSATVSAGSLFTLPAQSPTPPARTVSSSSLPTRPRRLGRTQSARPGINLLDFSQR